MSESLNKKPELVELGNRLKNLREKKGKSQKEAATDLGIMKSQSVLSSYELGDREPPIIMLNKLARYYDVSVDYLTGNSEYMHTTDKPLIDLIAERTLVPKESLNTVMDLLENILSLINVSTFYPSENKFYMYPASIDLISTLERCIKTLFSYVNSATTVIELQCKLEKEKELNNTDLIQSIEQSIKNLDEDEDIRYALFIKLLQKYISDIKIQFKDLLEAKDNNMYKEPQ